MHHPTVNHNHEETDLRTGTKSIQHSTVNNSHEAQSEADLRKRFRIRKVRVSLTDYIHSPQMGVEANNKQEESSKESRDRNENVRSTEEFVDSSIGTSINHQPANDEASEVNEFNNVSLGDDEVKQLLKK